jgi:DNA repair protein RecN (Recombination protein N)
MLSCLKIRNLALVEDLTWDLNAGLIGVTGETGAGKSIIVGALKLVMGERADRGLIRSGQEQCSVEASFVLRDCRAVDQILERAGLEPCENHTLILKRSISSSGGNKQFVNCSAATLQVLKELGELLVDLHGPHDHQSLHSQQRQLELLDQFAGAANTLAQYRSLHAQWQQCSEDLKTLQESQREGQQQLDMLRFQVQEIESAELKPDEEDSLNARHRVVANSSRLLEVCQTMLGKLSDERGGLQHLLRELNRQAQELERLDQGAAPYLADLPSMLVAFRELESNLQDYAATLDTNPAELDRLDSRIHTLQVLKRKYGPGLAQVIEFGQRAKQRLHQIENHDDELIRLEGEVAKALAALRDCGRKLTALRQKAAPSLAKAISVHLADLGLKQSIFEVRLLPQESPAPQGMEQIDFFFAPNPGEPPKALRLTASSGEMSRVLLAVKSALAEHDSVALMVFDEIDANVGGNIAQAVGHKMAELGRQHQVIAITHFPQVAALAASHFMVQKDVSEGRTRSLLQVLDREQRIEELARMLGGKAQSAREHALSLLGAAH